MRGEAAFTAFSADRLRVHVGDLTIDGSGAEFLVRQYPDRVTVTVSRGQVALHYLAARARNRNRTHVTENVLANQEATVWRAGLSSSYVFVQSIVEGEVPRRFSWRTGSLLFYGQPLADVIAEFNRYNRLRIVVLDRELASAPVGGAFKSTHPEHFVRAIESSFGAHAVRMGNESGEEMILLRPKQDGSDDSL